MKRGVSLTIGVVVVAASAGCAGASRITPGLANVPSVPLAETIDIHDVVANGHDSCPRARIAAGDPLRFRYPACAGGETAPTTVTLLVAPIVTDGPGDDLWNLHLRGLPPCEAIGAARSSDVSLAVCR